MNILLTSVGRRVELITEFKEVRDKLIPQSKVFTTDANAQYSAACIVADKYFDSPLATDPVYPEYLMELCKNNCISLVVPTIDTELAVLSRLKPHFYDKGE